MTQGLKRGDQLSFVEVFVRWVALKPRSVNGGLPGRHMSRITSVISDYRYCRHSKHYDQYTSLAWAFVLHIQTTYHFFENRILFFICIQIKK